MRKVRNSFKKNQNYELLEYIYLEKKHFTSTLSKEIGLHLLVQLLLQEPILIPYIEN